MERCKITTKAIATTQADKMHVVLEIQIPRVMLPWMTWFSQHGEQSLVMFQAKHRATSPWLTHRLHQGYFYVSLKRYSNYFLFKRVKSRLRSLQMPIRAFKSHVGPRTSYQCSTHVGEALPSWHLLVKLWHTSHPPYTPTDLRGQHYYHAPG